MDGAVNRREFLRTGLAGLSLVLAGCAGRDTETDGTTTGPTQTGTPLNSAGDTTTETASELPGTFGADPIASGLTAPLDIAFPSIEGVTAYVADQAGTIAVLTADGLRPEPFLDVRDRMVDLGGYEERGLLGLALHPGFAENRRLFVRYSGAERPAGADHTFVLSEFEARSDGTSVVPDSERRLLEIPEPQANHNAGPIVFGPDGYLYVGVGDGGGGGDRGSGHVEDWYAENDGGNGQDVTENLLGSILRIDVDTADGGRPYGIPPDNPLVGTDGLDEHFAWGFRNPWGMSFAREELIVADVGQNLFEEVSIVEKGGNYGWNVREGTHCFSTGSFGDPPSTCPDATPDGHQLVDPIIEYSHDGEIGGVAVVGGYLYEGSSIPGLQGAYVFADWQAKGRLYVATRPAGEGLWPITAIPVDVDSSVGPNVLGFGRDPDGELYVLTSRRSAVAGSTGAVHRLVGAPANG